MKKLIIASALAAAAFGAQASETVYACSATGVSNIISGENDTYIIREGAVITDYGDRVVVDFYGMKSSFAMAKISDGKYAAASDTGSIFVKRINGDKVSFMSSADNVSGVKFQPCIKF